MFFGFLENWIHFDRKMKNRLFSNICNLTFRSFCVCAVGSYSYIVLFDG